MKRILSGVASLLVLLALPTTRAQAQGYVVVVNAAGPSTLAKDDVSKAFLKKGGALVAVDQAKSAKVRDAFSKDVLGRPASAVATYWQQQIFAGKDVPPSEKGDDAAVLAFVKGNPKAIGYVAAGTELGAGVKAVSLQ
ncbi:MAG: phosphate ABC transporter substrate-binding protein [Gemmatirosa sp.]